MNSMEGTRHDNDQRKTADGKKRFLTRCPLHSSNAHPPSGHDHVHNIFPSYAQIMTARTKPGFEMRQAWERKARAKFSRTFRRHMRDSSAYSAAKVWTAEQSNIADKLLQHYGMHTDVTIDDLPTHVLQQHSGHDSTLVEVTWAKMQVFPA